MTDPRTMTKHVSKLLAFLSVAVLMMLTVALAPMFSQAERQRGEVIEAAAVVEDPSGKVVAPAPLVPESQAQIYLSFAPLVKDASPAAVNVYTACSTSMVAVSQAVAGLIAGDCDIALAGGVALLGESATLRIAIASAMVLGGVGLSLVARQRAHPAR